MASTASYDKDIIAWANEQAAHIRAGNFAALDLEHIAEEIEDVGKSEKRELSSRMAVLLTHLLKWEYQPERQSKSWSRTINEQRKAIAYAIAETQSLKSLLTNEAWVAATWADAVASAINETGMASFPEMFPWKMSDVLSMDWLPFLKP